MEYYQSDTPPPLDPKNLSGGVSFQFNGAIASGGAKSFFQSSPPGKKTMQTVTIQLCINGVVKNLDVYAAGQPYDVV